MLHDEHGIHFVHHIHLDGDGSRELICLLREILHTEKKTMALGQDILDAVTAEDTKVDSVIALIQSLKDQGTIPPDVAAAILAKVKGSEDKLDAAITANTTPPPAPAPAP